MKNLFKSALRFYDAVIDQQFSFHVNHLNWDKITEYGIFEDEADLHFFLYDKLSFRIENSSRVILESYLDMLDWFKPFTARKLREKIAEDELCSDGIMGYFQSHCTADDIIAAFRYAERLFLHH